MLFDNPNLLSNEEIRSELTRLEYPPVLIDSIIDQFWFHDWGNSFIAEPENFKILVKYLEEKNPEKFNRFEFYYYFFENVVPGYSSMRAAFQHIGLYFEQVQKNQIPVDEFNQVLESIGAPEQLTIEFLKEINFFTESEKDGAKVLTWTHHTLSEFLAADYILSQGEPEKELDKLVVEHVGEHFLLKPSWGGTLRFLIEADSNTFSRWCMNFLGANPDSLVDDITEMFVYSSSEDGGTRIKKTIFRLIYVFYQDKRFWIPVWAYYNLFKFVGEDEYKALKDHADDTDDVHRGNIAAVINGMLRSEHPLLTTDERTFWKEKLIEYANEDNEFTVLKRHALSALENYKGEVDIVAATEENLNCPDQLVKEAFVGMCRAIDANAADSIKVFVRAIEEDSVHIYARNALYSINSQDGILTFLGSVSQSPRFIYEFLENESIFNSREKKADSVLVENIRRNKSSDIVAELKKFIITALTGERNYKAETSYFLQQIALIIREEEPDYLNEFIQALRDLEEEQRKIAFINGVEGVLSVLLQVENLKDVDDIFKDEFKQGYSSAQAVRLAPLTGNPNGDEVLKKGIELGITRDPNETPPGKSYQEQQEDKIYEQFKEFLGSPAIDRYYTNVFKFFLENKAVLQKRASQEEKDNLMKLAVETNLNQVDPSRFTLRYHDTATKNGEYTITSVASYLIDVIEVINEFDPSILATPANRKKIIDFIPFVFPSDFEKLNKILGGLTDEELEPVNNVMLDPEKDMRYHSAQTYVYIAKTIPGLKSAKKVLLYFLQDPLLVKHEKVYVLENLSEHISKEDEDVKELLESMWDRNVREQISDLANGLLITVFQSDEAIQWRFDLLKSSATAFRQPQGVHSPDDIEIELMTKKFARPLIELNDEKFLDQFIDLLEFSLTLAEKPDHREYMNYLWNIAISFVARDNFLLSIEALAKLKSWAEQHLSSPDVNWLLKRITELTAYNNKVVSVVESKIALDYLQGKITQWTYELLREELKKRGSEQDIIFFISHASAGSGAAQGENDFVKKLNTKLKAKGYSTFFDEDYSSPSIHEKLNKYLPKSRFMIAICSERYRKRVCVDGAKEVSMELSHFGGREDVTKLQQIFTVTYKVSRDEFKVFGIPELQGGKMQVAANHAGDGEVDRIVSALLDWVESIDPASII